MQLIDARDLFSKMRKSLGNKRNELTADHIAEITRVYEAFAETERSKILPNQAFGYRKITVERPLGSVTRSATRLSRLLRRQVLSRSSSPPTPLSS